MSLEAVASKFAFGALADSYYECSFGRVLVDLVNLVRFSYGTMVVVPSGKLT